MWLNARAGITSKAPSAANPHSTDSAASLANPYALAGVGAVVSVTGFCSTGIRRTAPTSRHAPLAPRSCRPAVNPAPGRGWRPASARRRRRLCVLPRGVSGGQVEHNVRPHLVDARRDGRHVGDVECAASRRARPVTGRDHVPATGTSVDLEVAADVAMSAGYQRHAHEPVSPAGSRTAG